MLTGIYNDPGEIIACVDQGDIWEGSEGQIFHCEQKFYRRKTVPPEGYRDGESGGRQHR